MSATSPGWGAADLAALCEWAESLGYEEAWLAEVAGPDALVSAAAAAMRTRRMAIGIAVVPAYTRTAANLAMGAASVSQLLAGRPFMLGIGSSSQTIVSSWNGVPFTRPLRRVRETVEAVRVALSGDGTYAGEDVTMSRFRLAAAPAGPIALYVGALGPRMLRTAGAVGDGVCLNMMPARAVSQQLAEIAQGAGATGRRLPDGFGVMARLHVLVTDDPGPARESLRRTVLGPYLAQPVYNRFLRWCGYEEEATAIADAWSARDRDALAAAVHDDLTRDLTIIGSEAEVRRRLDEFGAAGVRTAALSVPSPHRHEVEGTLRTLAAAR